IDPCAEQPCQNSGVCVAAGDDFRCECVAPYYFGRTCEIVNCTNISVTGHSGFITTPGYPLVDYLANASCSWEFLHGSSIMSYTFMFTTFSVEGPSRTCDNDYLEIIASGRNSGLRFCGKMKNRLLTLSGPAKMRFVTNEIIQEKGFNVTYQYSLIGLCNSTLTTNEGHFFLPSAEIYKRFKGDICIWRIHPEKNKQIELSISVGGNVTGEDYYVEIYDSFDQVDKHMIAKISDRNGGTFSISNTASVKMLIPSQEVLKFSAFYKTEDIVHCDTLNCPTNSSCKMKDSVVFCACDDGHTNDRGSCSNVTCRDFVCQNGGKCNYDKFFGASCICRANFSGTHCEKDDLCDVHPCHPTGGACFHEHGQPICVCHPGFTGEFCSEKFPAFRCGGLVDEFPYGITLATNNQNGPCEWHLRPSSQRHVILINLDRIDFGPDCLNGELVILDMWKNVLLR
ncbi:EGF-like domain protein, partial [Trichuris suis]